MYTRTRIAFFLTALALVFSGCATDNSDEAQEALALCDNGVVDRGEECDDGNRDDIDACLSSCKLAICGDTFVFVGMEQCDGINLDPDGSFDPNFSCNNLGYAGGTLSCSPDCRHDVSQCGPRFTPTPTATPTVTSTSTRAGVPTNTPTTTPTPTPTRNPMCGNMTVEPGETCDDGNEDDNDSCPTDCVIRPCTPAGTTRSVQVDFEPPQFQNASSVTVLVSYPEGAVSLPGSGGETSVVSRVTARQPGSFVQPNDLDHALRVVYSRSPQINPGRLFLAGFDECSGATSTDISQFTCRIIGCANSNGPLEGCACSVLEPE